MKDLIAGTIKLVNNEKGEKELILGMDHNLDLLKGHEHQRTQNFLDLILNHRLVPMITCLTRITNSTATLIDNVFISGALQHDFDSLILLEDTSDHLPSMVLLRQTKMCDKTALQFETRSLNETKLGKIKDDRKQKDWNGLLRSNNCNVNFDTFCQV